MKIWQRFKGWRGTMQLHEALLTALVTIPFLIVGLSAIGFVLRVPVQSWYFPLSFFVGCATLIWLQRDETGFRGVLLLSGIFLGAFFFSSLQMVLPSGDGQYCHYPAISLLAKGWNPLQQTEWTDIAQMCPGSAYWHIAYTPHAGWICGAALAKLFGYVAIADSWSYWAAVLGIISLNAFLSQFEFLKRWMRVWFAIGMFFTPTIGWYWFTGTFDIAWYGLFLVAVVGLDVFVRTKSTRFLPVVLMASVLMCGIKATGVASGVVLFGVYGIYSLVRCRTTKVLVIGLLTLVLIPLVNPAPYVTNSINHCSPFYPAHSFDKNEKLPGDKLTWDFSQMNDDAKALGYWGRICYAWISQDVITRIHRKLSGKPKFEPETMVDVGGYGVLFRWFVVVALLLWPSVRNRSVNLFASMLALTIMIQPVYFSGYARYVNQFYLFPWIITLGFVERYWQRFPKLSYASFLLFVMPLVFLYKPFHRLPTFWLLTFQAHQLARTLQNATVGHVFVATKSAYHSLLIGEWCCAARGVSSRREIPEGFVEAGVSGGQNFAIWTDIPVDLSCCDRALVPTWNFEKCKKNSVARDLYHNSFVNFYKKRFNCFIKTVFLIAELRFCQMFKL